MPNLILNFCELVVTAPSETIYFKWRNVKYQMPAYNDTFFTFISGTRYFTLNEGDVFQCLWVFPVLQSEVVGDVVQYSHFLFYFLFHVRLFFFHRLDFCWYFVHTFLQFTDVLKTKSAPQLLLHTVRNHVYV